MVKEERPGRANGMNRVPITGRRGPHVKLEGTAKCVPTAPDDWQAAITVFGTSTVPQALKYSPSIGRLSIDLPLHPTRHLYNTSLPTFPPVRPPRHYLTVHSSPSFPAPCPLMNSEYYRSADAHTPRSMARSHLDGAPAHSATSPIPYAIRKGAHLSASLDHPTATTPKPGSMRCCKSTLVLVPIAFIIPRHMRSRPLPLP